MQPILDNGWLRGLASLLAATLVVVAQLPVVSVLVRMEAPDEVVAVIGAPWFPGVWVASLVFPHPGHGNIFMALVSILANWVFYILAFWTAMTLWALRRRRRRARGG